MKMSNICIPVKCFVTCAKRWWYQFGKVCSPSKVILFGLLSLIFLATWYLVYDVPVGPRVCLSTLNFSSDWVESLDTGFEGFDNESGIVNGPYIVPNYVHFLRYSTRLMTISFLDAVCILAAYKNQKPDKIFFHTNIPKFGGKYWDMLMKVPGFNKTIEFQFAEPLESIYGQPLNPQFKLWHSSDLLRIDILRRYGGIFIDNDVYLVQNMDRFRRFEMTVELPDEISIATQTLVAHRDARFLRLWLESYKKYYGHLWYYNAGHKPRQEILYRRPELVHGVHDLFGTRYLVPELYVQKWKEWKSQYTIHLLTRHIRGVERQISNFVPFKYPDIFDETNIRQYNITKFNITIFDMILDCCTELLG